MAKKEETMFERGVREEAESAEELMKEAAPKTPLEAAIDRATGFKPEDMLNVARETKQGDSETEQVETETEKADSGTGKPETGTEKPDSETEKRDWVEEAYKCFIKEAQGIDPANPVRAVEVYFNKNATDELKARCKAEGKDAKGCWRFIEAVASKALHGSSGHIDPGVVYAIAMHWFEDVPKDWDKKAEHSSAVKTMPKPKKPTTRKERLEERVAHGSSKAKAELRELKKKERDKAKAKAKAKKPKQRQGFFFEMLETPATTPEQESEVQG